MIVKHHEAMNKLKLLLNHPKSGLLNGGSDIPSFLCGTTVYYHVTDDVMIKYAHITYDGRTRKMPSEDTLF